MLGLPPRQLMSTVMCGLQFKPISETLTALDLWQSVVWCLLSGCKHFHVLSPAFCDMLTCRAHNYDASWQWHLNDLNQHEPRLPKKAFHYTATPALPPVAATHNRHGLRSRSPPRRWTLPRPVTAPTAPAPASATSATSATRPSRFFGSTGVFFQEGPERERVLWMFMVSQIPAIVNLCLIHIETFD